ncbi:glycoside hydrolase family 15 protein [Micromonospora sp. NBC_01655]|uniref:glycoside hydrolase family 15 protein n=1 Tax=Micromonospora sp. NBC_01655 TaxID=2975983 RepID=UPI00225BF42F|nr:glycoside hydrolase family 15 protein [Micromonospora sp. NBC_01655]MCX4472628.1 glycoside hydrolase family 15 protein [Micromonospora sp. NBC_01655]
MTDTFPAIDAYAFLSDTHSAALVGPDGSVDWFCVPRFDGPSVFGRLLDRERGGAAQITVVGAGAAQRRYVQDTLVLESRYLTDEGAEVLVHDFLAVRQGSRDEVPIVAERRLVRCVRVVSGYAMVRFVVDARPDYGRGPGRWRAQGTGRWRLPELRLLTNVAFRQEDDRLLADELVGPGELRTCVFGYDGATESDLEPGDGERIFRRTCDTWRDWTARAAYDGPGREQVLRSALVLRGLSFDQTGALLAAATTSLPESFGGVRNWDYRFTWPRDAALVVLALFRLRHAQEGGRFLRFLLDAAADDPYLPAMFGIDDVRRPETRLPHLRGYRDSRPVRVGNEAFDQFQLDVYGHLLDAALTYHELSGGLPPEGWERLRHWVEDALGRWREPDHGVWEIRNVPRHYVNSKVMAWVCLDRAIRLAEHFDDDRDLARWRAERDEVHRQVIDRGYDERLGCFVQAYDSTALDAAVLRLPLVGFLPPEDPRIRSTIDVIHRRLGDGVALVHRYDTREVDDGLPGSEPGFLLTSFEMVSCLALTGRRREAQQAFDWLCARAGDLGLYAEEMAGDGTATGNYPQAFTHLALIEAALHLDATGREDTLHKWARVPEA